MENQNSSYSVQIGKTTFIVCVKQSETAKKPIEKMFKDMCRHGAAVIRLDAFAYAVKKADTSCFFIEPDIWELLYDIEKIDDICNGKGLRRTRAEKEILVW